MEQKNISKYDLVQCKLFETDKLDFLFSENENVRYSAQYGFNFTDLMKIREEFGLAVEFLLMGIYSAGVN